LSKKNLRSINGLILLDKPLHSSSNQVLQRVKRLFQAKKAGHTGSLDVLASGLLPICLGEATKYSHFLLTANKRYDVRAYLGKRTTTCDAEGNIIAEKSIDHISCSVFQQLLTKFHGQIEQEPSMFSALKHHGQPLYRLARQGITVPRKKRLVSIYDLKLLAWNPPEIDIMVVCSKGTYIRNLVNDIGIALGCGAYVSQLRRTGVGHYRLKHMYTLSELMCVGDKAILPIHDMLSTYPYLFLSDDEIHLLYQGKSIIIDMNRILNRPMKHSVTMIVLMTIDHRFTGVGKIDSSGCLKVKRLLAKIS